MRDGERLVRYLTFQDVDRPPFYQHFLGWDMTYEQWQREAGVRRINLQAYFNMDFGFENVPVQPGMVPAPGTGPRHRPASGMTRGCRQSLAIPRRN